MWKPSDCGGLHDTLTPWLHTQQENPGGGLGPGASTPACFAWLVGVVVTKTSAAASLLLLFFISCMAPAAHHRRLKEPCARVR